MLLSLSSTAFLFFSLEAMVFLSLSTLACSLFLCFRVFEGLLVLFSCFQDRLECFFPAVSVFAVRFYFQDLILVLLQVRQSWLEFARFCFSDFADHLLIVEVGQHFFPIPSVVFLLLATFVYLLL